MSKSSSAVSPRFVVKIPFAPFSAFRSVQTSKPAWLWDKSAFSIRLEWFRGRFDNRELCPFQRHWDVWTLRKWRNC
jgi:hypothetical protein